MSSNRLILIFLGFIFLIIILLSSNRIAASLRKNFGKFVPIAKPTITTEINTPTPTILISETETPAPTSTIRSGSTPPRGETPATGPNEVLYLILGGSLLAGISLQKISTFYTKD